MSERLSEQDEEASLSQQELETKRLNEMYEAHFEKGLDLQKALATVTLLETDFMSGVGEGRYKEDNNDIERRRNALTLTENLTDDKIQEAIDFIKQYDPTPQKHWTRVLEWVLETRKNDAEAKSENREFNPYDSLRNPFPRLVDRGNSTPGLNGDSNEFNPNKAY